MGIVEKYDLHAILFTKVFYLQSYKVRHAIITNYYFVGIIYIVFYSYTVYDIIYTHNA